MRPEDHPAERTARLVGRQWTALVVLHLERGPLRHSELLTRLCGISQKTLTERLRELERHDAVNRQTLPGPTTGTLYSLTERGKELAALFAELAHWGAPTLPPASIVTPPGALDVLTSKRAAPVG